VDNIEYCCCAPGRRVEVADAVFTQVSCRAVQIFLGVSYLQASKQAGLCWYYRGGGQDSGQGARLAVGKCACN